MPVIIGVAANTDLNRFEQAIVSVPLAYTRSVERTGAVPLILPLTSDASSLADMLARVDGVILPGGIDVDPAYFGQTPHPALGQVDKNLDVFQLLLVRLALEAGLPILGICRGAQVINVALGGTLVQDIPSQFPESKLSHAQKGIHFGTDHEVTFKADSRLHGLFGPKIRINSRHHQSIDVPGSGLVVTATAPDGVVEGAEHETQPIDLIQWHPELLMQSSDAMLPLFQHFTDRCRNR